MLQVPWKPQSACTRGGVFYSKLFPSIDTLHLLTDLRSTLRFPRYCSCHRLSFFASGVSITAAASSPRYSSHQALSLRPNWNQPFAIWNTTFFTSFWFFLPWRNFMIRSTSILVPTIFGACDFTLMKLLLESTIAASVIFGHARHAKTVAVPRKNR